MTKTPRHMAVEILNRVEEEGAFAESILDASIVHNPEIKARDRRLITQIVYGTLRMRGHLDWIIETLYNKKFNSLDTGIKNILRASLYQLLFTERIPDFAIVNEAVTTTKTVSPAGAGLVNAILRNYVRRKEELVYPEMGKEPALYISTVHSHPLWLVRKWIGIFGREETKALCRANNKIPPVALRVNTLKTSREGIEEKLRQSGFKANKTAFSPDGLIISNAPIPIRYTEAYSSGMIQIQDEGSQLITRLVSPKPGENILDVCAGMGGKTTHLAAAMENRGNVLAVDISARKIDALRRNAKRLGVAIIDTETRDARQQLQKACPEKFDRILVDAPCSGLGTLRRNPEIKWRILPDDVLKCSLLQRAILENAAPYLKKEGFLIYSTCTVTTEENEDVVEDFIKRHPEFICVRPLDGIDSRLVDDRGYFRSYPHRHDMDAFFGAVLVRTSEGKKID